MKLNFDHWSEFIISNILHKNGIPFLHMINTWERKPNNSLLWSFMINKNNGTFLKMKQTIFATINSFKIEDGPNLALSKVSGKRNALGFQTLHLLSCVTSEEH